MGQVKSALEKALERMEQIEDLTPEEKEELRDEAHVKELLASFYKGRTTRDDLWKQLKGRKHSVLVRAQLSIIEAMRLESIPEESRVKRDGILAIESLKDKRNTSAVDHALKSMEKVQEEFEDRRQEAIEELRTAVQNNPQLRMRPMRTANGRTAYQASLSVEEAVQAKLAEFLPAHQKKYEERFNTIVEKLRQELR